MTGLPLGWVEAQLGDLAEIVRGVTDKKQQARSTQAMGFVPVLRATNIGEELELNNDLVWVPTSVVNKSQYLRPGDIVIASSSGSSSVVGKSARLTRPWTGAFGAFCAVARPRPEVDASYLAHFVGSPSVRRSWSQLAAGTSINNLKRDHITSIRVPLPPLAEQQRIVAAVEEQLSRLDAAGRGLARAARQLDRLRHAILLRAIDGDWPTLPFGSLVTALRNGVFASRPSVEPPGTPILRISAVRPMTLAVDDIRYAAISPSDAAGYFIEDGDLLFTRYSGNPAYVGACARVRSLPRPTLHPDKLIRVAVDRDRVDPGFVEIALAVGPGRAAIEARLKTTAGQVGIAGGRLRTVPIPLPPLDVQRRIVDEVEAQLSLLSSLERQVVLVRQREPRLRQAILREAFAGRLVPQGSNPGIGCRHGNLDKNCEINM